MMDSPNILKFKLIFWQCKEKACSNNALSVHYTTSTNLVVFYKNKRLLNIQILDRHNNGVYCVHSYSVLYKRFDFKMYFIRHSRQYNARHSDYDIIIIICDDYNKSVLRVNGKRCIYPELLCISTH